MRTSCSSQCWSIIHFRGLLPSIARSALSLTVMSPVTVLIGCGIRQLHKGPVPPSCSTLRVQLLLRHSHGVFDILGMYHRLVAGPGRARCEDMTMIVTVNVVRLVHHTDMAAVGIRLAGEDVGVEDRTAEAAESTTTIRDDYISIRS